MTHYTLYGGELSLFTRKLEAALLFYQAPFKFVPKAEADAQDIEKRSGTHQVPVLLTPENWMLGDTTPILSLLDGRFARRALFPEGAAGVLVHVLEEFFDEWVARVMVHYRWHYAESARFASLRMANGNRAVAERVLSWGPRACRATGTESPHQQKAAEEEYLRLLSAAETQLQDTAFLLGDRPTALDCIVLGGLRAHTNMDPDPKRVMAQFSTVIDWAERRADTWDGTGQLLASPHESGFARHVLGEMSATYGRYVLGNRDAQAAGARAFHVPVYEEEVSFLARPYPEQSRAMIVARLDALATSELTVAQTWLKQYDLLQIFS